MWPRGDTGPKNLLRENALSLATKQGFFLTGIICQMDPAEKITKDIADFPDWRGEIYKTLRETVLSADSEIEEVWKWNSAVYEKNGLLCSISAFKNHVGMHFFKGAQLKDPDKLFNAGLDAKTMRNIKFFEGDSVEKTKLSSLVKEAISVNDATA